MTTSADRWCRPAPTCSAWSNTSRPSSGATSAPPSAVRTTGGCRGWTSPAKPTRATADESREEIVGLYRRVAAHSDTVIEALPRDAVGHGPWWPAEYDEVTLHWILVHTLAETHRDAGHADIVRELVDGSAGYRDDAAAMTAEEPQWWVERRARLEGVAREAQAGRTR